MSWLTRNRRALIALVVLVPFSIVVAVQAGGSPTAFREASERIAANSNGVAQLGGVDFRVTDAEVFTASAPEIAEGGIQLPAGTQLVVVTVEAQPSAATAGSEQISNCEARLVGMGGTDLAGVVWENGPAGRLGFALDDDAARDNCDLSQPGEMTVQFSFLTPKAELADLSLRVTSYSTLPSYLLWPLAAQ